MTARAKSSQSHTQTAVLIVVTRIAPVAHPGTMRRRIQFHKFDLGDFPAREPGRLFSLSSITTESNNRLSANFNFQNWRSPNGVSTGATRTNDSLTTTGMTWCTAFFSWRTGIDDFVSLVNETFASMGPRFRIRKRKFLRANVSLRNYGYGMPKLFTRTAFRTSIAGSSPMSCPNVGAARS